MAEFFHMGGYAAYVWPCYGLFFVLLLLNWALPAFGRRRSLREVKQRLRREAQLAQMGQEQKP